MNMKMKLKVGIDIVMVVLLFTAMAYPMLPRLHKGAGMAFFALVVAHQLLNWQWWKGLFRGRFTKFRILQAAATVILLAAVLGVVGSGSMVHAHGPANALVQMKRSLAGVAHVSMAYWAFIFAGLHLGFNWNVMQGMLRRVMKPSHLRDEISQTVVLGISVYGAYVFYDRYVYEYLLMLNQRALFNIDDTPFAFAVDFFSMFVLFAFLGLRLAKWRALKS